MSVRAKFKVVNIARSVGSRPSGKITEEGRPIYESCEVQTITLQPVYGNGDPTHENTKFWQASPTGQIQLGTVNEAAGSYFELNGEYYIDFTKAPAP